MDADRLSRIIMLLFGKMEHGGPFWCYVAVKPSQYEAFRAAQDLGQIDLYDFDAFGEIVVSDEGERPPQSITERVAGMYGVDPSTFFQPTDPMVEIDEKLEKMKRAGVWLAGNGDAAEPSPTSWVAKVTRPRKKAEDEVRSAEPDD